jgi:predicted TIM-barrel fold metal-dependent hydrolase
MRLAYRSLSRRAVMGAVAAGAARILSSRRAHAQATGLIDFHAHFLPAFYVERAVAAGQVPDGMPAWPTWSVDDHLFMLDVCGIETAVLSLSSPGVHFGDDAAAAALARQVNDEAAALVARSPTRFRFLASLPLPDVEAAIEEWRRVRSAQGCLGAIVLSHSGAFYPGATRFDPLWRELNATGATVLLHPSSPPNWRQVSAQRPRPMLEFYFESARACLDLFKASVVDRFPNVRFLIPHCGGALPIAIDRLKMLSVVRRTDISEAELSQVRKLWFDCAGSPFPVHMPALMEHASEQQVVYGSDFCFTPGVGVLAQLNSIRSSLGTPDGGVWMDVLAANGRRLLG